MRGFVLFATLFLSLYGSELGAQTAGAGRSFTICMPYMAPSDGAPIERVHLAFTSEAGASVTLLFTATGRTQSLLIPANSAAQITIDTADLPLPREEGIYNRTLRVQATTPITASVVFDRGTASEAYGVIADSLLGLEYVAVGAQSNPLGSFVVIAATEDETTVTVRPSITTLNDHPAGEPYSVMIHKGQVYQIMTKTRVDAGDNDDLSGTHIIADKPVGVWSGTTCSDFPIGNNTCGPLIEHLPSTDFLGRRHPIILYSGERETYYNVVAPCAQTAVYTNDVFPPMDIVFPTAHSSMFASTIQNGEAVSSLPALVAHVGVNISPGFPHNLESPLGDPTMAVVTPIEQMATKHRFVVPTLFARAESSARPVGWVHIVDVVRSSPGTFATLDGSPIPFTGNLATIALSPGEHTIIGDAPLSVTSYGRSISDAYAFVPAPVVRTWPLHADSIAGPMCGDEFDTTIWIRNATNEDIMVDSAEFIAGLQGEVVAPSIPFVVRANDSLLVTFRFTGLISGSSTGSVVLRHEPCDLRVLRIPVWLRPDRLQFDPAAGPGVIEFPHVFPGNQSTMSITITNPARYPVTVERPIITALQFDIVSPGFPLTLPPGGSQVVTFRFTPAEDDRVVTGEAIFQTRHCPNDSLGVFNLLGVVRRLQAIAPPRLHLLCEPKEADTLFVNFVNRGDASIRFDEIALRGDPDFSLLLDRPAPVILNPGDSVRFRILYAPGPLGTRSAVLRVSGLGEDFDSIDVPIEVQNDLLQVSIDSIAVDLGNKACDSTTPARIAIVNRGNVPAEGLDLRLLNGGLARLDVDLTNPLAPGDTLVATLSARDSLYGRLIDTLRIFVPGCNVEYLIPVQGRCAVGTIEIAWGDEEGEIGEWGAIPLRLTASPATFAEQAPVSIRIVGRMKKDVLLPNGLLSETPPGLTARFVSHRADEEERIVEIELTGELPPNGVLTTMEVFALLGSDSLTTITIDTLDFRFLSDVFEAKISSRDGTFRTLGFCNINYARLVDASGSFALRVVPNPIAENAMIEVELVEDGPTSLRLMNEIGETVATLVDTELKGGLWQLSVPMHSVPNGSYRLLLTTRTQSVSTQVMIVR